MTRWKCTCAYDGWFFNGWQSQSNGCAVQDILELKISEIFNEKIRIHGGSRTDSGVHARGQVFHFDAEWKYGQERLKFAINSILSDAVRIMDVESVDSNFHARFSAKSKMYTYALSLEERTPFNHKYCLNLSHIKNIDIEKLKLAAHQFVGTHNFSAFAGKVLVQENPIKSIYYSDVEINNNNLIFKIHGSGFLYRMVRMIVSAILFASQGKLFITDIVKMLTSSRKIKIIPAAPPFGLYLEKIHY